MEAIRFQIWALIFSMLTLSLVLAEEHSGHGQRSPARPPQITASASPRAKEERRVPIDVPREQQIRMGLKVVTAKKTPLRHTIRTVGTIAADETKEAHIHTRVNGWIDQIYADSIGKPVKKGQPLFELYSPDLVSTQEEYLVARSQGGAAREIARAALERLSLWGLPESEIRRLQKEGRSKRSVTFTAPVDGYVVNKTAIQGMYITPELELYHIADLSKVWVIITLYEYDVSIVNVGDTTVVQLAFDPYQYYTARINYIYPEIAPDTRTAKARIELSNPKQALKPGMFMNVEIRKDLGEAVTVPEDSVIDTGVRQIVFVKTSGTRFEPRAVKVGPRVERSFAILEGLKGGEEVVSSAQFLMDTESKFQAALQKSDPQTGHSGHGSHGGK